MGHIRQPDLPIPGLSVIKIDGNDGEVPPKLGLSQANFTVGIHQRVGPNGKYDQEVRFCADSLHAEQ